ncbi:Type 4 prepilin-like proteins leader peptide-processing enzyme [Hydrogenovibrio crunogenus]|uniref:Prepilin leader peptidase/N-methyltransferase n=1 Tax=Hydrogenovibrio crunogenus TaxID=39765 RepID=A0A4P7NZV9_9GAMM|nr:A24 family peptidase [Hydrogenovibrio crunogenus]QBZ83411.1 Type 4 prepilin-like proteins leader peptide-processing enzyme [Hydrogenovibrio crunogenus]
MLELTQVEAVFAASLLGLIIGSFISMLTWRLPRMLYLDASSKAHSLTLTRSKCPHCENALAWYQLIPVFSWFLTKGKCLNCQTPISVRYPLIELSTMLITGGLVWYFGQTYSALIAIGFSWTLLTILIIDIEHQLILDSLSLPLMWVGLLINSQSYYVSAEQAILGAAIGYLLLWTLFHSFKLLTGKEGMGYGDFKLLAALGAWFGVMAIPQIILIASLSSLVIGGGLALFKVKKLEDPIPFGPFLAIGGWSSLLLGSQLI